MDILSKIKETSSYIKQIAGDHHDIAIILGSGLGPLASEIENPIVMKYENIPNFKVSTIAGHAGELVSGTIQGKKVLVMNGRFHYYEGHDMDIVTFPVRVFASLGITNLLVTNAAGGIHELLNPGSIMLIHDHLSIMCPSPLRGPNLDDFGPRFKDMTEVYTKDLRDIAHKVADTHNIPLPEGVYCYFTGPQYETPAEIRAVRTLGADAAGMSTVPEAIIARHCGMRILGLSLITNKAAGLGTSELSHSEVTAIAKQAESNMLILVKNIIGDWK